MAVVPMPVIALTALGVLLGWLGVAPGGPGDAPDVPCVACHVEEAGAGVSAEAGPRQAAAAAPAARPDTMVFTHEVHVPVACERCHVGTRRLNGTDYAWCDGCHHAAQPPDGCARCHDTGAAAPPYTLLFDLPGGSRSRSIAFPHPGHETQECASCHGAPPGRLTGDFSCSSCHEEHHETETVDCLGCHREPPAWAHEPVVVHTTCSGAVCHDALDPGDLLQAPRSLCEACHDDFRGLDALPPIPESLRVDTTLVGSLPTGPSV